MSTANIPSEFRRFPKRWKVLPFAEAINDKTGGNPKIKQNDYLLEGNLAVVDQGQSEVAGFVEEEKLKCKEQLPCILFGDHTKIFKYIEHPFALGADGVKVLVPSEGFDKRFIYHYLNTIKLPETAGYSRHFKFLKETFVPRPQIQEQKRIAAILDKADNLHRKRQQAIQLADEFLRAVFLDMFGDPGLNSKHWPMGSIRDLASDVRYGSSEKAGHEGNFPMLRMNNITFRGGWDFSDLKYINLSEKDQSKFLVHKSELLFNRTNSKELVGKTAVYREKNPMAFAGYLIRVKTNEKANPEYISAYLNSLHGKITLQSMCKSIVGMANINAQELQDIKIALPPRKLQDNFAEIVHRTIINLTQHISASNESINLFNSLSQKAFQGHL